MASSSVSSIFFTATVLLMSCFQFTSAADPDPLQDFCVADNANANKIFVNGVPCINPAQAKAQDFKTSVLNVAGNTNNELGSSATLINTLNLPGINTQGLILARVDFAKKGVFPPHSHPRASELVFVIVGKLTVGFLDTNNTLFTAKLDAGDVFAFPRGLLHFLQNVGSTPATALVALNSQNPGVVIPANALFGSSPPIPDLVLEKAFSINEDTVEEIRKNLGG